MKPILANQTRFFPCCICGKPREVRTTKKGKPYLHCDPCGLQMFVRIESGIHRFEALIADADRKIRTLLLWVRQGKVTAFALSGTKRRVWRFRREDLDSALLSRPVLSSVSPTVLSDERRMIE
jgi:hypothetical protein